MAMKHFLVSVGEKEIDGKKQWAGREVYAEHLTIEHCGAATFWKTIIPGQSSALILAFAPGEWTNIELIPEKEEKP